MGTIVAFAIASTAAGVGARADEYDDALRCVVLIEMEKDHPASDMVDQLRKAGDEALAWADRTRPADLTDQQKIDRFEAVVASVTASGGLPGNEEFFYDCTAKIEVFVVLRQPPQ